MLEVALCEFRPRLQSLIMFAKFSENIQNVNFKIEKENTIVFSNEKETLAELKMNFDLLPDSLSSVKKEDDFLAFRLSTENISNSGSFKAEILKLSREMQKTKIDPCKVKPDVQYDLKCKNCDEIFFTGSFKRVLPLPNSEQQGWFCHGHVKEIDVQPKAGDFLYSISYFVIPSSLLGNFEGKILKCKRCFNCIGYLSNTTCKIWFNTVKFTNGTNEITSNSLQDARDLIKNTFVDNIVHSVKIAFVCKVSEDVRHYLLIWVLEKDLQLLKWKKDDQKADILNVFKISFKFVNNEDDADLKQWLKFPQMYLIEVSKVMIEETLDHLQKNSLKIPKTFRLSANGYVFSYLVNK